MPVKLVFLGKLADLANGASPEHALMMLRSGLVNAPIDQQRGVISFPSMHIGVGVIILYVSRQFGPLIVLMLRKSSPERQRSPSLILC